MDKPRAVTPTALLEEFSARQPNHECVIDGERRWTYAQLHQESQNIAAGLYELGVRRGH